MNGSTMTGATAELCDLAGLRERRDVLDRVSADAARARAGTGRVVLVCGPTGTGRSALLEAVAARESRRGMRVLRARCSPEDSRAEFAAVAELLDADLRPPAPDRQAWDEPGTGEDHSLHGTGRAARLWRLLRSHAAAGPLLLLVDDVHLADPSSRGWFVRAARLLDRLPVLLVLTERSQYDLDPPPPCLLRTLPSTLFSFHTLAPLSFRAAAELVRERLGAGLPPGWIDGCLRATGGVPLFLHALLTDLGRLTAVTGGAGTFPDTGARLYSSHYTTMIAWALESAGPATAELARTLAELDTTGDTALLADVAGTDPGRTGRWIDAMASSGLVVRAGPGAPPRVAHPLLRDAVLDGWPHRRRQEVHRAAAELLYQRGESAGAVARRLLSVPAVGAEWAVNALLEAAATAVREGRTRPAGDFLRRALDEPLSRERRGQVLTELGCLEADAGRPVGVRHLAEAVPLRQPTGSGRLRTTVALGTALARGGDVQAALEILRNLCEELPDRSAQARAAQAAGALLSAYDRASWLRVMAGLRHVAAHSPDRLDQAERALLVRYEATAGLISAKNAVERLCVLSRIPADPALAPYVLATVAAVLQWAERYEEVDRIIGEGLSAYRPVALNPALHALADTRADAAAARGRYGDLLSDPAVRAVLENPRPGGPADASALQGSVNILSQAVLALLETGRRDEAWRLADRIAPHGPRDSWEWNRFLHARGELRAADGDYSSALADFRECGRRQTDREVLSPVVTPWRSGAAECLRRLGRTAEALELAEEEYRLALVWGTPRTVGRALRVLGTVTGGRRGTELSQRAVAVLRTAPEGVERELVLALIALGDRLTAAGERGRARTVLREAAGLAGELGARRMVAAAERSLVDSGARVTRVHSGVAALTESERRIAGLAAEGRTNAEICELLHLARRTVETHLTSAYRKLGIRRRSELPAALGPLSDGGA
ncbi:AAA family ATPase [Streptomyces xinghaiensis]|uniref:AAA family ATPase n=1 Tax=Streptomyces xinghaiensis TaxID=1038928 RepID=UPI002E128F6A|nr:LuxR family transcriptional regulator [Streptomyces xinghaiensis]